jgi:symplekin
MLYGLSTSTPLDVLSVLASICLCEVVVGNADDFRRDATGNFAGRIQQYVDRLVRSKAEIFDSSSRKRGAGEAQSNTAASGDAKRRKLGADAVLAEQALPTPLGPGPHSLAAVYSLTNDASLRGFDASVLPAPLVARITTALLANLDLASLVRAVEAVRARLALLESAASQPTLLNPDTAPLGVDEDEDDDYEPDFYAAEDTEQILNKLDGDGRRLTQLTADYRQEDESSSGNSNGNKQRNSIADLVDTTSDLVLGSFALPAPIPLDPRAASNIGQAVVERFLGQFQNPDPSILSSPSIASPSRRLNSGSAKALTRNSWDRDTWLTLLIRLATRSGAGLEAEEAATSPTVKSESALMSAQIRPLALGDSIRNLLYSYILENFRSRIDVSVAWLCEEWYNDQLVKREIGGVTAEGSSSIPLHPLLNYEKWTLRLVDGFLPYLTPQDKVLTRFLGEIPELSPELLDKIRALCSNPDMVNLALTSLLYVVMMRPPARELALDKVAAIHDECKFSTSFFFSPEAGTSYGDP